MKTGTILPADITAAVVERVKESFPEETVYTDLVPRDFARPCNMVELIGVGLDPLSYGQSGIDLLYKYRITTFSQVDEVHASHLSVLALRAMLALGAFGNGFLRVRDRAPKVRSVEADTSFFDCVPVTLTLALTLDRAAFAERELYELMRDFTLKIQAEE